MQKKHPSTCARSEFQLESSRETPTNRKFYPARTKSKRTRERLAVCQGTRQPRVSRAILPRFANNSRGRSTDRPTDHSRTRRNYLHFFDVIHSSRHGIAAIRIEITFTRFAYSAREYFAPTFSFEPRSNLLERRGTTRNVSLESHSFPGITRSWISLVKDLIERRTFTRLFTRSSLVERLSWRDFRRHFVKT